MANKKKLQRAAIKFRKENIELHHIYSLLLSSMSNYIKKTGAAEVTVGYENGYYYEHANNKR